MAFLWLLIRLLILLIVYNVNCEELKLVTRLPKNPLIKYTAYSSVMILHFEIPDDTTKAVFVYKAKDSPTSMFVRNCDPRNVSVYMKNGAYPVINPDGVPFPTTFLNTSRPHLYNLTLETATGAVADLKPYYINITAPVPGNWFAVAFVSWTDPKNDRIEQQGLSSECDANLYAELYVVQKKDIPIIPKVVNITLLQKTPRVYKFFVSENIDHILIAFEINACPLCGNIIASVQATRIPNEEDYLEKLIIKGSTENKAYYMQIWPYENKWHYLDIRYSDTENTNITDNINIAINMKFITSITFKKENKTDILYFKSAMNKKLTTKKRPLTNILPYKQYDMMRINSAENFIFEYDLPPFANGSSPIVLNVTNTEMSVLKFEIYDVIDIGGTLSLGFAFKPEMDSKKVETPNVTIIACIRKDVMEVPTFPDECFYNDVNKSAPVVVNNTVAGTLQLIHIPFPDAGTWYITLRAFYEDCLTCKCSDACQKLFTTYVQECEYACIDDCSSCVENGTKHVLSSKGCSSCDCDGTCLRKDEDEMKNISMIFSISSHPCVAGRCGKHGKCNHYIAGGFIYSACQCFGGYRGWDCSDGSQAHSESDILLSILLLTLSNLLFILSVFFAYRRSYYTEAVVYFFTMFFSTFYHACDSEEAIYGFCLFRLNVLQFCDFYCGLLSIWVTLVAMSHFGHRVTSIGHICGAVLLAFGTIYNKQALWVFLMPALSGLVLIGIGWGLTCRRTKKLFPAKRYLIRFMPIGIFLVLMGLISFAFLQTKDNYKFVHSFWHVIMAVSVIFLLPTHDNFIPKS